MSEYIAKYTIPATVSEAAHVLDAEFPEWEKKVNTDILQMASVKKCVLGQVLNGNGKLYYDTLVELFGISAIPVFYTQDDAPRWITEINQRLNSQKKENKVNAAIYHNGLYPYPANVAEAAMILDNDKPDWYTKIDLDTFNMKSPARCVLGQTYGNYSIAKNRLTGNNNSGNIWATYTDEWRYEIKVRRERDIHDVKEKLVAQSSATLADWELGAEFVQFLSTKPAMTIEEKKVAWWAFQAGYKLRGQ